MAEVAANNPANEQSRQPEFFIHRIYVKDLSIELPNSPGIFVMEWRPEIELNIRIEHKALADLAPDTYEVLLFLKVTAKLPGDKIGVLVELTEAGIFKVAGWEGENLERMLGAFCPSVIFPYAREVIADCMSRASLQPLHLAPINFDVFFDERKKQQNRGQQQSEQPKTPEQQSEQQG